MAFVVFPSEHNIGGGQVVTEDALSAWVRAATRTANTVQPGYVYSGFSAGSAGLNVTVQAGVACLNGRLVIFSGNKTVAIPPNYNNCPLYLYQIIDGDGYVTGVDIASVTLPTPPEGSTVSACTLWSATSSGSAITGLSSGAVLYSGATGRIQYLGP